MQNTITDDMGVTVKQITQPSGNTYWFTVFDGRPSFGYGTKEKAEQSARECREIRREKLKTQTNQP
jgi:hypothetical protein